MSSLQTAAPELLEVAAGIGRRLADEAIWHDGRCNWIGGQVVPGPFNRLIEHQGALDSTLYEGTTGVALFLAELHAATGDSESRPGPGATARAAVPRSGPPSRHSSSAATPHAGGRSTRAAPASRWWPRASAGTCPSQSWSKPPRS